MSDDREKLARENVDQLLSLPPEQREAAMNERCGHDPRLRARVLELMAAIDRADVFLSEPTRPPHDTAGPTNVSPSISEQPGSRIGPYKLLQQIGEGGFGVVFLAEQMEPVRRRVALKVIKLGMDTRQVVARFEAERQALALMDHPNIARVFDAGATEAGRPYFVMEYVVGDPITEFADAYKLTVEERLALFSQVCQAVQHAHTKGLIHRDLKPGNVLVSMIDGRPFAKIIDFGIAKATWAAGARLTEKTYFTEHNQLIGTLEYMSPEQAVGSPDIDTRTDIYALGVILYELLTGLTPFDAVRLRSAAWAEVQRILKEEEPPRPSMRLARDVRALGAAAAARRAQPSTLGTRLRGELDWIVMKSLDKDRSRRYESPNQLAADIQRHLAGEPVIAAPPGAAYRVRKFVRKHRGQVLAASVIITLLVLGLIGTGTGMMLATDRAQQALRAQENERIERIRAQEAEAEAARQRDEAERSRYAANIFAAAGDPYSARQRLEDCPEHLRGWEWRYLNASTDLSLSVMEAPESQQWTAAAFSPDGATFATGSTGEVAIWESSTGTRIKTIEIAGWARDIEFSPDGNRLRMIVVNDPDGPHGIWSLDTHQRTTTLPSGSGVFSPDGRLVLTWSSDKGAFQLTDATSGEILHTRHPYHNGLIVAFSPDGAYFVTSGNIIDSDGETRRSSFLWNTAECEIAQTFYGPATATGFGNACFSPDGSLVAIAGNTSVEVWDTSTSERIHTMQFDEMYVQLRFSPDGRRLYGGPMFMLSNERQFAGLLWDVKTGMLLKKIRAGDEHTMYGDFSPDGTMLIAGAGTGVGIWDVETGTILHRMPGHSERASTYLSPDGTRVLTTAWDGTARLWSVSALPNPRTIRDQAWMSGSYFDGKSLICDDGGQVRVYNIASSTPPVEWDQPDIIYAAVAHEGRCVTIQKASARVWDCATGRLLLNVDLPTQDQNPPLPRPEYYGTGDYPLRCALDRSGRRIVVAFGNGSVRLLDLTDGRLAFEVTGSGYPMTAISPDGSLVAVAWDDHIVRILDATSGREITSFIGHTATLLEMKFDPSSTRIATMSDDRTIRIWSIESSESLIPVPLSDFGMPGVWYGIGDFDPSGRRIVLLMDNVADIRDAETGESLMQLHGHRWWIDYAVFTPDGSRIATASGDGTVRIWSSSTGQEYLVLRALSIDDEGFTGLAFSPDGKRLIACGSGGPIHLFDTTPYRELEH